MKVKIFVGFFSNTPVDEINDFFDKNKDIEIKFIKQSFNQGSALVISIFYNERGTK